MSRDAAVRRVKAWLAERTERRTLAPSTAAALRAVLALAERAAEMPRLVSLLDRAAENAYEERSNRRDKLPLGELRYELRVARDALSPAKPRATKRGRRS